MLSLEQQAPRPGTAGKVTRGRGPSRLPDLALSRPGPPWLIWSLRGLLVLAPPQEARPRGSALGPLPATAFDLQAFPSSGPCRLGLHGSTCLALLGGQERCWRPMGGQGLAGTCGQLEGGRPRAPWGPARDVPSPKTTLARAGVGRGGSQPGQDLPGPGVRLASGLCAFLQRPTLDLSPPLPPQHWRFPAWVTVLQEGT